MSQICRRWFISTRMYLIMSFWGRTKSHQNVPNLPPMIYFQAYVSQKEFLRAYEIAPKCPKFAANDLFPRVCNSEGVFEGVQNRTEMSQICRQWFISTRMYLRRSFWGRTKSHRNVPNLPPMIYFHAHVYWRKFWWQFLLISLLRSRGSLRLPRSLRAWIRIFNLHYKIWGMRKKLQIYL